MIHGGATVFRDAVIIDFSYHIIFPREAPLNRRAAGAVDFSAFRFHYEQTKSSGDWRPGGEAFVLLSFIFLFSGKIFSKV